nr:hypothetical protein [Tanacetum cinerariifolium]
MLDTLPNSFITVLITRSRLLLMEHHIHYFKDLGLLRITGLSFLASALHHHWYFVIPTMMAYEDTRMDINEYYVEKTIKTTYTMNPHRLCKL